MTRLQNAEQLPSPKAGGGTYIDGPWRFVCHTTEVVPSGVSGARAMASRHANPPHLWYWPQFRWLGQTVPLSRSAFALRHGSSDPHTNKRRAIQVEIIGRAADTPSWPVQWWRNIAEDVLVPVINAGYPINLANVAATTGGDGYGLNGRVRMSWAQWAGFDGVCGHANVPGNSHWDIGAGRLDLIAHATHALLAGQIDPPAPELPPEEDPMLQVIVDNEVWLLGLTAKPISLGGLASMHEQLTAQGVKVVSGPQAKTLLDRARSAG